MRRCLVCARSTGGRHRLCRGCHAEVEVRVEDVALRSGRVLRLCRYRAGEAIRILVAVVDSDGIATGVAATFSAELLPAVRQALARLEKKR